VPRPRPPPGAVPDEIRGDPDDDNDDLVEIDDDVEPDEDDDTTLGGQPFGPRSAASTQSVGTSRLGPYENGSNMRKYPKQPPMGRTEGGYDPMARPASATRKAVEKARHKIARRCAKLMAKGLDYDEALRYASLSKRQRKAYNLKLAS
jgi:hypothetical protein